MLCKLVENMKYKDWDVLMKDKKRVIVVIPAYEPDYKMIQFLKEIKEKTVFEMIVVDDGSGENYYSIFHEAKKYAKVLSYKVNKGKGEALKTAFSYLQQKENEENIQIVTADADGQHTVDDMMKVVSVLEKSPGALILGSRAFTGKVPFRSKIGNKITSKVFELSTGMKIKDTQTGLRAFNGKDLDCMLQVEGKRYEYEMNVLSYWTGKQRQIKEYPIETIYIDENKTSHFHPVRDSIQIYKEIIKFSFSSLVSFGVDYLLYMALIIATGGLPVNLSIGISNVVARMISATVNYTLNREFVFKSHEAVSKTGLQYIFLAAVILILNTLLLGTLVRTVIPNELIAKVVVEGIMFIFSCYIQKNIIFKTKKIKEQC